MSLHVLAADTVSLTDFASVVRDLGVLGVVCVVCWALFTERLVPGNRLREREEEFQQREQQREQEHQARERELVLTIERWQRAALSGTNLAERMMEVQSRKGDATP